MIDKCKLNKVLIANRGEIALRIRRACDKRGIRSVQVISEADQNASFAQSASEVALIGPAQPHGSYLNIPNIIRAAQTHGCDAVHPGYGFLSENAAFAQSVIDAGLTFIGPAPHTIEIMGSKTRAREEALKAGVLCVPGCNGSDDEICAGAQKIGFPVLIKAVGGGGGRGMRVAHSLSELQTLLPLAKQEALKNFAAEEVFIEKFIDKPRHIEVQILGCQSGNIVHLGTRDCSTQRRHQKLVEEAPAPNIVPHLREQIHQAALRVARAVRYFSAGTVEFLLSGNNFYFLEMNTRIQVEHPVTEAITGVDLVDLQLQIAVGEPLPFAQEDIRFSGHAIEFRINAEDVTQKFTPVTGSIEAITSVTESFIREDCGFTPGDEISPYYDSLISKVVISGSDRNDALFRAHGMLNRYSVTGIETTIPFHQWLLCTENFQQGPVDIHFVEREFNADELKLLQPILSIDESLTGNSAGEIRIFQNPKDEEGLIQVMFETGSTYVMIPTKLNGERYPKNTWRRSSDFETTFSAVLKSINEALRN